MKKRPVTHIKTDDLKGTVRRSYTDVLEGQMHYRFQGKGKILMLLHMAGSSSDEFTRMIPLLSEKYHVVAPDHLGFGESDMPPREYSITDYSMAIVKFMDSLKIEKASILGTHSGAQMAVEIAASHQKRVESLILCGLPCRKDPKEGLAKLDLPEMQRIEVSWDGSHLMDYWERANRFGESVKVCNERALDYYKAGPRGEELHEAGFKYFVLSKLARIQCPTLLVCGSEDWLLPGSEIAQEAIPGSNLVIVEGGRAMMCREYPKEVASIVINFLDDLLTGT